MFHSKLLVLLAALSLSNCHGIEREEGVYVLTSDNFDHFLAENPNALVEFYAPWCGHCKTLAPEYAKAAQALENSDINAVLGKVDATVHKDLGEKFGVKGFPTLKFFKNGQHSEYNGGRTEATIVAWLTKKLGPSSVQVSSEAEILAKKSKSPVVVYFGAEDEHYNTFLQVAGNFEDIQFAHCFDAAVKEQLKASQVTLFKDFDELRNEFTAEFSAENLEEFIQTNSIKTIMFFDEKAAEVIFSNSKECVFLLYGNDASKAAPLQKVLEEASAELKGKVLMSDSKITEGLGSRLAEFLGVNVDAEPKFMMITFANEDVQKYSLDGENTVANLLKFVKDVQGGAIQPTLKSEEVPAANDEPVKVVVGKTFEEIVLDDTKDVLVEFYAPWCGHCKSLAPKYDELAKLLAWNKNIVIAKMDSTLNEVKQVSVKSFPTIKLWTRGNKANPIDYNGEREVDGFVAFLKEKTQWVEEPKENQNEDL